MEKSKDFCYAHFVNARRLAALAVAAGYFMAANCRLVCALGMPSYAPALNEHHSKHDDCGSCHHHEAPGGEKNRPAPCCTAHLDSLDAALPSGIAAPHALRAVHMPVAVSQFALSRPQPRGFGMDPDPPLRISIILVRSSLSPRAPPFPPAVLFL